MKLTISRTVLLTALSLIGKALSTNNIMNATQCYQFTLDKSSLRIACNNLETFLSTNVECKSDDTGKVLVPANKISFIKDLPEQPVTITVSDTFQIEVKYNGGKISFSGYDGEDFPLISHESTGETEVQSDDVNEALFKTLYCVATDNLKPSWNGVAFDFMKSCLRITSLNGYIASTCLIETESHDKFDCIIPKKSLEIFQGLPSSEINVSFGLNSIKFSTDQYEFISTIIDDSIPPVQSAIPGNTQFVTVDKTSLIGAIKRISQFSLYGEIILDIDKKLTISGENSSMSEVGEEKLDISLSGKPSRIGFKSDQLLPSLTKITTELVNIYYNEPKDAVLLRETQTLMKDNLILVRPINIPV